ncbi:hypothetical protein LTR10_000558 [Elasticomyces elasticus]|uniref:Hemerythrin-like domain-containing protein n=1 Tax=Elasticomyces elasticus TaxID=574655 RepID=A0AAN7W171_9PEZI|nr:hypothetical protein LTR10_000558 [Elasticomyces elasticus]KAK4980194.1 hypothetical protein LTR42_000501 [Elasticomyces elasticus]KAK5689432.1 hypothetical protein LTR97_012906 [Elasticomyces elasticus]
MAPQWADQPYALNTTTEFSKDTSHAAYHVATEMALAHNGMLRGLNSIYIQAPFVPKTDLIAIRDLQTYCQCWCEDVHHHHDAEETNFFPAIERITGIEGLMERNVEQHRAFTPGFEQFEKYVRNCSPKDFDGQKLRGLIEDFAEPLNIHLKEEIDTLRDLDKYDSKQIQEAYRQFEKLLMSGNSYRVAPLVFGTADRSFEGGMHNFPAVPFFVPW